MAPMKLHWMPLVLALASAGPASGQVLVAPVQLFLGQKAPMGTFYVYNQSKQAQEVSLSFRFGYPVTDEYGALRMVYGDTLSLRARSMQDWVRAFPRQFVLAPGERQEVRITTRAPRDLPDGLYWTRLATASAPQAAPVDTTAPGVNANITFRLEQVTTVLYAAGSASTALLADTPRVRVDSSAISLLARLAPGGNSPFFGTGSVRILNERGAEVDSSLMKFAAYVPMVLRYEFAKQKLPAGRYVAELSVVSERDDISPKDLLHVEPVLRRVPFTIP